MAQQPISNEKKLIEYQALVKRDGEVCQWCGRGPSDVNLEIDHIVPGGGEDLANKQLLCGPCNAQKGASTEDKTVRWVSALWQQGFTMVPNVVLTSETLSVYAHRIYSLFLYYARQAESCFPGQEGLAKKAKCSDRQVRESIRELEQAGLVRTRRRGRGETNVYILLVPRTARGSGLDSREEPGSVLDRNDVPTKKKQLKQTNSSSSRGWPPKTIDGLKLTEQEIRIAERTLSTFNETFGKNFRGMTHLTAIVKRHREHPEADLDALVAKAAGNRWWEKRSGGDFSPNVIFGNANIFERTLNFEPAADGGGPDLSRYDR